ncbi:rho GDP-dissociation inhibitor 1-like [Coffea arabica]|uniref:Rho GDP-dissociation inhibitor 1 n=1 Tax=Coffea arabica TaxID=13443 RepID=A0A6P6WTT6_COFAR|nr:rho GDP-dissociation inhibitor 1-like [Coffea arabica]
MSASVETLSPSKHSARVSPFNENDDQSRMKKGIKNEQIKQEEAEENGSKSDVDIDERENDDLSLKCNKALQVSSSMPLEKDKNNGRHLQSWKEHHLAQINIRGDTTVSRVPEVEIKSISIMCRGRPEIVLSEPFASSPKALLFILKEGSRYRLRFNFIVSNKIVTGLRYVNTLWKAGMRVDKSEVCLGSFSPKEEPYSYELEEDTAPSGIFVRGLYCARTKVIDDHQNCYLDIKYYFEIQKTWPSDS